MKRKFSATVALVVLTIIGSTHVTSSADAAELVLITESSPVIHFLERVPIQVQFLASTGLPIPEAEVIFLAQSDTADTALSNSIAFTDARGIAETFIETGTIEVVFDVLIGVRRGDDVVPPITVHVSVIAADAGIPEASWPSEQFRSIQDAIYALADGGTLRIAEGVYDIDQPIFIRNKMVNIVGGGANCKELLPEAEQFNEKSKEKESLGTVLVGPSVEGWVAPEESIGNFNFNNAGGSFKGIWVKGAKAGIVGRDIDGAAKPLDVSDACISDTVRGIHWKANASLTVTDTTIADVEWNGISIAQGLLEPIDNHISDIYVSSPQNYCIAVIGDGILWGTYTTIKDSFLAHCSDEDGNAGGGVIALNTTIFVEDSYIWDNHFAGIVLKESAGFLTDNSIHNTQSKILDGYEVGGDGILLILSPFVLVDLQFITDSARIGITSYGSHVEIGNTVIRCASAGSLQGENWQGVNYSFVNLGDVKCGCPNVTDSCVVQSVDIVPPDLTDDVE